MNFQNIIQKKEKKFNYGLAILKSICEFLVVAYHNFNINSTQNKIILNITSRKRLFHVPCFFIMSFYFMCRNLLSLKPKIIFNRLIRLFIPYIIWPIIFWKLNRFWNKKYNSKLPDSYNELKLQLLWGHNFTPIFWFLWNLIAVTLLFIAIIAILRKYYLFFLQILLIFFYIAQYSGFHYKKIFKKYSPSCQGRTLGYFFEIVPLCITGFTLGYFKIIDILKRRRLKVIIISLMIYNVIEDYNIIPNIKGLLYQGIKINIQSVCLIFAFYLIPFDNIKNKYLLKFLIIITNYTAGIYYLHYSIRFYLGYYFDNIKNGTFCGLFITYFFCYIICFIGMLIFGKTSFKFLFC